MESNKILDAWLSQGHYHTKRVHLRSNCLFLERSRAKDPAWQHPIDLKAEFVAVPPLEANFNSNF